MIHVEFGAAVEASMFERFWGLDDYLNGEAPEFRGANGLLSATRVEFEDPGTGAWLTLRGEFYPLEIAGGDYDDSTVSEVTLTTSEGGELVVRIASVEPISVALMLEEDDPFPLLLSGDDEIVAGLGNDGLFGAAGDDTMLGRDGDDTVDGGDGDDRLEGGKGDDRLEGGSGNDALLGDDGDDWLLPGPGADTLYGGRGVDIARLSGSFELGHYGVTVFDPGNDYLVLAELASGNLKALVGVERVEFEDYGFALDLDPGEEAYDALSLLSAGFGAEAVDDTQMLGGILAGFRSGLSMEQVAQAVIDAKAPPGFTTEDLIYWLHDKVTGQAPEPETVAWLQHLGMSQSELYVYAASFADGFGLFDAVTEVGYARYALADVFG